MQATKALDHYYLLYEHHCKRKTCIMCEWENFVNPSSFMCSYGKTLVQLYNKTLDKAWNERTYYTTGSFPLGHFWAPDADGSELAYELGSWRENGMGLIQSIRETYRLWRNPKRSAWGKRLSLWPKRLP